MLIPIENQDDAGCSFLRLRRRNDPDDFFAEIEKMISISAKKSSATLASQLSKTGSIDSSPLGEESSITYGKGMPFIVP